MTDGQCNVLIALAVVFVVAHTIHFFVRFWSIVAWFRGMAVCGTCAGDTYHVGFVRTPCPSCGGKVALQYRPESKTQFWTTISRVLSQ